MDWGDVRESDDVMCNKLLIHRSSAWPHLAGRYYVNLERRLLELVREARWLGRLGVELPEAARALLPQEAKLRRYYDALTHLLLARLALYCLPHPPCVSFPMHACLHAGFQALYIMHADLQKPS
jgi:hypothetical protein